MDQTVVDLNLMVNTAELKIGRIEFPDGDDVAYVVAFDRPTVIGLSMVVEYVPENAKLEDVEYEGDILVLTFVVRP